MTFELDDLDIKILSILMEDCNKSAREIARELDKSPTTIAMRLKKLQSLGIIKKCSALVNYPSIGFGIMALIMLNVEGAHIEEVERIIAQRPNVRAVYDITGDFDVAVIALFRSVEELDRFIKQLLKIPYVKRSVTSIILKAIKDDPNIDLATLLSKR